MILTLTGFTRNVQAFLARDIIREESFIILFNYSNEPKLSIFLIQENISIKRYKKL